MTNKEIVARFRNNEERISELEDKLKRQIQFNQEVTQRLADHHEIMTKQATAFNMVTSALDKFLESFDKKKD